MTIDERLEALTHSVELLASMHRDLEQQTAQRFAETAQRFAETRSSSTDWPVSQPPTSSD